MQSLRPQSSCAGDPAFEQAMFVLVLLASRPSEVDPVLVLVTLVSTWQVSHLSEADLDRASETSSRERSHPVQRSGDACEFFPSRKATPLSRMVELVSKNGVC